MPESMIVDEGEREYEESKEKIFFSLFKKNFTFEGRVGEEPLEILIQISQSVGRELKVVKY